MLFWIIIDKKISNFFIQKYEMKKINSWENFSIYKNFNKILLEIDDDNILEKALLHFYTEYNPNYIFYVWLWDKVSNEHQIWDIVLPNVFLEYNKEIENVEFKKENLDSYFKDAIFIENYHLQNDYDFDKFWLSIGWICVSWDKNINQEQLEKIRLAYEADIYDNINFTFINECKSMWILDKIYILNIIWNQTSEWLEVILENWVYIIDFIIWNLE